MRGGGVRQVVWEPLSCEYMPSTNISRKAYSSGAKHGLRHGQYFHGETFIKVWRINTIERKKSKYLHLFFIYIP